MDHHGATLDLQEWETQGPDQNPRLRNVFLDTDNGTRELINSISRAGILKVYELRQGLLVSSSSYVGRIRIGSLTITVRPKISNMQLAPLLRYAYGLRHLRMYSNVAYDTQRFAFHEILIRQLIDEARELLVRGLHRKYLRQEADLHSPRERIDIRKLINQRGGNLATLPCIYHPRSEDCLENQVVLAGLRLAYDMTSDLIMRADIRFLVKVLEENISELSLTRDVLLRISNERNRLTRAYDPAMTIIGMLLNGHGVRLGDEPEEVQLAGFMFDMNRFFQALLSRFLRDNLSECQLHDEYRLSGMIEYVSGANPLKRRVPRLRPDFVVLKNRKVVAVLDAKYRDLWETSLPREMLYQLAMYALAQQTCKSAAILYPTMDSSARESRIVIRDLKDESQLAEVIIRPVDLNTLTTLILSSDTVASFRERMDFAEKLAF